MKKINDLPKSDSDFWDGEKHLGSYKAETICAIHKKDWASHVGYKDNHDGTISCKFCNWGCFLPGYMKMHKDKVFDLRQR